jgi:hypothetical protein
MLAERLATARAKGVGEGVGVGVGTGVRVGIGVGSTVGVEMGVKVTVGVGEGGTTGVCVGNAATVAGVVICTLVDVELGVAAAGEPIAERACRAPGTKSQAMAMLAHTASSARAAHPQPLRPVFSLPAIWMGIPRPVDHDGESAASISSTLPYRALRALIVALATTSLTDLGTRCPEPAIISSSIVPRA